MTKLIFFHQFIFQRLSMSVQCRMILQKSLYADLVLKVHFLLLSTFKTVVLFNIPVKPWNKCSWLFDKYNFLLQVFTLTFDQM